MSAEERGRTAKKKLPVLDPTSSEKTVLPEVLPDPRHERASSAPRARTLAHMQRLLALGAAVGLASVSCGKSNVKDPSEKRGCGKGTDDKASSSGDDTSGGTSGYAVVDPMPMPAHCPNLAPLVDVQVTARDEGGLLVADVTFRNPRGRPDFKYVSDAQPVVMGGSVMKTERSPDGVVVTVRADSAAPNASSYLNVAVKGACDEGPTTLSATITWSGPVATTKPQVSVNQY